MSALKPCPFCDSLDIVVNLQDEQYITEYAVDCHNCGARGPGHKKESMALELWNTRRRAQLPASIQQALNEGDGIYRP